jgi:hypothetical protein
VPPEETGVGIRETLQKRPSLAAAAAGVMIVGGAIAIYVQARDFGSSGEGRAFFTTDDGKTFFADRNTRLAPFEKDGKQAVRAHVFECGGQRVVGYLSCYRPEAIRATQEPKAARDAGQPPPNPQALAAVGTAGLLLKRPGDPGWVSQADAALATQVRLFRCPDGSTPEELEP